MFGAADGFPAERVLDTLIGVTGVRVTSNDAVGAYTASRASGSGNAGAAHVVFGDDFSGAVDLRGSTGNDTFNRSNANEILIGGRGNDLLDGADGGSGFDTLVVTGAGAALDFSTLGIGHFEDIERIDLSGGGDNHLVLRLIDVLNLSSSTNTLWVEGNAGDSVAAGAGVWTRHVADDQIVDGVSSQHDVHAGAQLMLDADLSVSI